MESFVIGQRWVNDAELQLGLGTLISHEGRTITLMFAAAEETRTYATHRSPLSRVRFEVGELIRNQTGIEITIALIQEYQGLFSYQGQTETGEEVTIPEGTLDPHTQFNLPNQRLFTGQIDRPSHFELRRKTAQLADHLAHSELRGLNGSRTSLIPHQLYIANEVAKRHAPRVLLADEVGLGKTIEAGLILNYQLTSGRAQRVLILVPETLIHQWLVEMLRRFNLHFSLFDQGRIYSEDEEIDTQENPFETEQLVICSIDFLVENPEAHQLACDAEWDLLIVDEAHHLEWTEESVSTEYQLVEELSQRSEGLLLLTATPEQLGKSAHFARLRLLDPSRFHDFETFVKEEQSYGVIAELIDQLEEMELKDLAKDEWQQKLTQFDSELADEAKRLVSESDQNSEESSENHRESLVDHLLDRHGTGRVLFRNTRNTIKGFPGRKLHTYALECPDAYALDQETRSEIPLKALLHPEVLYQLSDEDSGAQGWTSFDPRLKWLLDFLSANRKKKVLVIAASAITALDIADAIRMKTGEPPAVFHEDMSIVERDRAAAYFADTEYGSQSLVCSEIGSEGRNFQFAHHLVLFDLPLNPDLLEQRIGRLDRIGQTDTINIHMPFLEGTAQETLVTIYHQGTNAFENISVAALKVFGEYRSEIETSLRESKIEEGLLATLRARHDELEQEILAGRDRLLEYNSCRPGKASRLMQQALEQDNGSEVSAFIQEFSDIFGIEHEIQTNQTVVLHPSDNMMAPLPALPDDGLTITYERDIALAQEDLHFMTAEHPLLIQAMDSILTSETGSTSLVSINYKGVPKGTLLVECIFTIEGISSRSNQSARYLASTSIRTVLDQQKRLHTGLTSELLEKHKQPVKRSIGAKIVAAHRPVIEDLLNTSKRVASKQAEVIRQQALEVAKEDMQSEIERLHALKRVNPNVRDDEILHEEELLTQTIQSLERLDFKLDAIRILVNT